MENDRLAAEKILLTSAVRRIMLNLADIKSQVDVIQNLEVNISAYVAINEGIVMIEDGIHRLD